MVMDFLCTLPRCEWGCDPRCWCKSAEGALFTPYIPTGTALKAHSAFPPCPWVVKHTLLPQQAEWDEALCFKDDLCTGQVHAGGKWDCCLCGLKWANAPIPYYSKHIPTAKRKESTPTTHFLSTRDNLALTQMFLHGTAFPQPAKAEICYLEDSSLPVSSVQCQHHFLY